jgi:basic amino acid/polyamine antiporter, APA family
MIPSNHGAPSDHAGADGSAMTRTCAETRDEGGSRPSARPGLVRAMGRWTLAALMLNSIIGSGIFGLPSEIHRLLGTAAPLAYLLAAAGIGVIMACFAEVASQYRESGGIYLYARDSFGRFVGIQMGWMALLVRVTAHAAIANLLVVYLAEFVPAVMGPVARAAILVSVFGALAIINIRGVKNGAIVSNAFTAGKLIPLLAFVLLGLVLLGDRLPAPAATGSAADWSQALLALMFAYGGFEAALLPMAEAKNPRRDVPLALALALVSCAVIYTGVHLVVLAALPDPSATTRPLADAARVFLGPAGGSFMALAAVVSIIGILSAGMLNTPRLFFALAEGGDFPGTFGAVHHRFRTPHVSLAAYAVTACVLAISGTFIWNAVLSAVGRLFTYGVVCAALVRLRHTRPQADAFRVPGGPLLAVLGIAFAGVLVSRSGWGELMVIAFTMLVALVNWLWAKRRASDGLDRRDTKKMPGV